MTMTQRDTDALPSVRACVTALPEQLLSPPYEMRSEMNWIDFSGTANPLARPLLSSALWRPRSPPAS